MTKIKKIWEREREIKREIHANIKERMVETERENTKRRKDKGRENWIKNEINRMKRKNEVRKKRKREWKNERIK